MAIDLDGYAPFNTGAGSNVYESVWREMMVHMLGSASGIVAGIRDGFAPFADSTGMQVKVKAGECWIRGHWGKQTTQKTLPIAAAHATLARVDRIVLRANFVTSKVEVDVLTGTPSASPVAPAMTQSTTRWETHVGLVNVGAAVSTITAGSVVDNRVFTLPVAKYRRTVGSNPDQTLGNNITAPAVLASFAETTIRSGDVESIGGDRFELQRDGIWIVNAKMRMADNGAGGARQFQIVDYDNRANVYSHDYAPALAGVHALLSCTAMERFQAGKRISIDMWQNSGSNVAVNNMDMTFIWFGP